MREMRLWHVEHLWGTACHDDSSLVVVVVVVLFVVVVAAVVVFCAQLAMWPGALHFGRFIVENILCCLLKCRQQGKNQANPFWLQPTPPRPHFPPALQQQQIRRAASANGQSKYQHQHLEQPRLHLQLHCCLPPSFPTPECLPEGGIPSAAAAVFALQRRHRLLPKFWLPHYKYNINFYVFIFSNASVNTHTHTHVHARTDTHTRTAALLL